MVFENALNLQTGEQRSARKWFFALAYEIVIPICHKILICHEISKFDGHKNAIGDMTSVGQINYVGLHSRIFLVFFIIS